MGSKTCVTCSRLENFMPADFLEELGIQICKHNASIVDIFPSISSGSTSAHAQVYTCGLDIV